jgi:molecular chaperone GrpE
MAKKKDKRSKRKSEDLEAPESEMQTEQITEEGELTSLQAERDDLLGRLQRIAADYQNYQKRMQRDIAQAREFANEELIKSLLGVLDDMERALEAARTNHDEDDPLLKGMQMVHDKALETLKQFGLQPIEAQGQPFDPDQHSAMMQEPSPDAPPQTVLRELAKGYRLKGRTIRPSAVVVSQPPTGEETQQQETQTTNGEE